MAANSSNNREIYYTAFKAHDPRFDGHIYIGVSSTGIYCRPVCRVRTPKEENCHFYTSAAAAEAAGYRPCLKCRPELAPGAAPVDAAAQLAHKAALHMEEDYLFDRSLEELAESLGVTDRHLRRVFTAEYGVSPVQYLQTCRLLIAKSLLTDTNLTVTDIAFASGFGSTRRLNDLFQQHYRLSPSQLRRQAAETHEEKQDQLTLYLGYRPPYQWEALLDFFRSRAIIGVEAVTADCYQRTVALNHGNKEHRGWFTVQHAPQKNALAVTLSVSLLPVLPKILARIKQQFDLHCDPTEIYAKLAVMNEIKPDLCTPGSRLPGSFDPFEMAVRAVLGQQITVKAAHTLAARIVSAFGQALDTPLPELTHTFPTAAQISQLPVPIEDQLGPLGVTGARARTILALANALVDGSLDLSRGADPEQQMNQLLALPGIGPWTAQYIAMRALSWPDAFPHTDYGIKKALAGLAPKEILALAENWRPWRAYATINLWNSL